MIVKVHGVFPSNRREFVSSQTFQFHRAYSGDSGRVVTPFMPGRNLPDKEFRYLRTVRVTAAVYQALIKKAINFFISQQSTGQVSDPIPHFTI